MNAAKKFSVFFLAAILLGTALGGCSGQEKAEGSGETSGGEETADGKTAVPDYEYIFREIGEQKFIEPAESFAGGTGTENDPYQISNAAELALLSEVYEILAETQDTGDERVEPYYQAYYVLSDDIVINGHTDGEDWLENPPEYAWTPIGFHEEFRGSFDGAGHKISGLYINADVSEKDAAGGSCFGLFGENQGTIKNVTLEAAYICVGGLPSCIGGIAGRNALEDDSVENCTVSADIYCYDAECGGIVGGNRGMAGNCVFSGTVTCLREDTVNGDIGGIVGYNNGAISGCSNNGAVSSASTNGSVGGIAGSHNDGEIRNCENTGSVSGGESAGGVAGMGFIMAGGGKQETEQLDIINCKNTGAVSTDGKYAGGIAGQYTLDYSGHDIMVSGCENTGSVKASEKIGGVLGLITLQGDGSMTVTGCANEASLSGEVVGGVLGSASELFGTLTLTGCRNSGEVTAELYGAGIAAENNLMTWEEEKAHSLNVTISGCENTGKISTLRGGGVAGVFVSSIPAEYGGRVTLTLENDVNSADIYCAGGSGNIGGIAGNVGVANGAVIVKDCRVSGALIYPETDIDEETTGTTAEEYRMEISRIGGGITGMVDSGIFLATNNDGEDKTQVNNSDAKIIFSGCHSDMTFSAPDEDEIVYDDDGEPVFLNRFGGILGFCSDDQGLAFRVENCTYTGCDRGFGNVELPDVGTKQ